MAATFTFDLVSPEQLLISRPVEMAILPAAEGEMGVLPGHAPMIVTLQGGIISVVEDGKTTERLFVSGGFAEVTQGSVTVLADEAIPVAELSRSVAAERLGKAEAAFAALPTPTTEDEAMQALDRIRAAQAMAAAAQRP